VGYGDFVPVAGLGRIIARMVMMVGISVLGVVSAGMAATLVKQNATPVAPPPPPPPTPADEVLKELAELKQMVAALQTQLAGPGGAGG
jgi:voltage-gated potassium channel